MTNERREILTLRVKLARTERARRMSHVDYVQALHNAVERAGLPVVRGRGGRGKLQITPGPPLTAGYLSRCEYVDFHLSHPMTGLAFARRLDAHLPPGLHVVWQRRLPPRAAHLRAAVRGFKYTIGTDLSRERAQAFHEAERWPYTRTREKGRQSFDLKRSVVLLDVRNAHAVIVIRVRPSGTPKVEEVLESVFGYSREQAMGLPVERTDVQLAPDIPLRACGME